MIVKLYEKKAFIALIWRCNKLLYHFNPNFASIAPLKFLYNNVMKEEGPIYSPARNRRSASSSGGISSSIRFVILILLVAAIAWVYTTTQQQTVQMNNKLRTIEQNQTLIKEALKITDENFSDIEAQRRQSLTELADQLEVANEEIRKLWGVANDRNKKSIATLEEGIGSANKKLQTIEDVIKTDQERTDEISKALDAYSTAINGIKGDITKLVESHKALTNKLVELEKRSNTKAIEGLDSRIASLEGQRGSQNSRFGSLQQDINLLRSRLLALENSLSLPTTVTPAR